MLKVCWHSLFSTLAIISLVVGSGFTAFGLYLAHQQYERVQSLVSAQGVILGNQLIKHRNRFRGSTSVSRTYYPIVEFNPAQGPVRRFRDPIGTDPPEFQVGDPVNVLYSPTHVGVAYINSWSRLWLPSTVMVGVGTLPILIALGLTLADTQHQRSEKA